MAQTKTRALIGFPLKKKRNILMRLIAKNFGKKILFWQAAAKNKTWRQHDSSLVFLHRIFWPAETFFIDSTFCCLEKSSLKFWSSFLCVCLHVCSLKMLPILIDYVVQHALRRHRLKKMSQKNLMRCGRHLLCLPRLDDDSQTPIETSQNVTPNPFCVLK